MFSLPSKLQSRQKNDSYSQNDIQSAMSNQLMQAKAPQIGGASRSSSGSNSSEDIMNFFGDNKQQTSEQDSNNSSLQQASQNNSQNDALSTFYNSMKNEINSSFNNGMNNLNEFNSGLLGITQGQNNPVLSSALARLGIGQQKQDIINFFNSLLKKG